MKQQRIDDLEDQLSRIRSEIKTKESLIRDPNCLGIKVQHKKFGAGEVTSISNGKLEVFFEGVGSKQFLYPAAFENGFLQPEEPSVMEQFRVNKTLEAELSLLREKAEQLQTELAE